MSYAAICPTVNVATADEAALILRKKIGLRLKGGPHGLMRCWLQFRERAIWDARALRSLSVHAQPPAPPAAHGDENDDVSSSEDESDDDG